MKTILILLVALTTIFACNSRKNNTNNCIGKAIEDCVCTMQYDPVCGCDGKTYGNACTASCQGVKSYTKGECDRTLTVTKIEHGKDGYVATLQNHKEEYFTTTISIPNLGDNYVELKVGDNVIIEGDYSEKANWIDIEGQHPTFIKATKITKL